MCPPNTPCRSSPKHAHWNRVVLVAQGEGGWFRWVEEKASHTHGTLRSAPYT